MSESAIVAAVQPRWKRYEKESLLKDDMRRFLRLARDKGADMALFPELTGLMLAGPLALDKRSMLQKKGSFLERLFGSLGGAPELADALPILITEYGTELTERYVALWGELAREYRMIIVGGTLLAATEDGSVLHRAGIFDKDGSLMGWQAKLHLSEAEGAMAQGGDLLHTFDSDFGRFGVLVGYDLLFPELARALVYRGCIGILNPTLARSSDGWRQQRIVAQARAQENQIYLAQSFLIGTDDLFPGEVSERAGRSSVLAPVELTPRGDAVLGEVGAEKVEGVVTGTWNVEALHNLWETTEVPVRRIGRGQLFHELLAFDYQSGATIAERTADLEEIAALERLALPAIAASSLEEAVTPDEPLALSVVEEAEEAEDAGEPVEDVEADEALPVENSDETEPLTPPDSPSEEMSPTEPRSVPIIDPETGHYLGESLEEAAGAEQEEEQ